jgi:hypothetical protein
MKVYEAIRPTDLVDQSNTPIGALGIGDEATGEMVVIDGVNYLQTESGFIKFEDLGEVVDDPNLPAKTSSSKKFVVALVGLGVGFAIAKYRKMNTKNVVLISLLGLASGLAFDYYYNKKNK